MSRPAKNTWPQKQQADALNAQLPDSGLRRKIAELPRPLKARLILAALKKDSSGSTAGLVEMLKPHLGEKNTDAALGEKLVNGVLTEFASALVNNSHPVTGPKNPAKPDRKKGTATLDILHKDVCKPKPRPKSVPTPATGISPSEMAKSLGSEHYCVTALALSEVATGYVAQVLKFMNPTYAQKTALSLSDMESGRQNISKNVTKIIRMTLGQAP